MNKKDRISSFPNPYIDGLITHYTDRWHQCSHATAAIIRAYYRTNDKGYTTLFVEDMPCEEHEDVGEFTAHLIEAGINEFILADNSTRLMRIMIHLFNFEWEIVGTYEDDMKHYMLHGLKIRYTK